MPGYLLVVRVWWPAFCAGDGGGIAMIGCNEWRYDNHTFPMRAEALTWLHGRAPYFEVVGLWELGRPLPVKMTTKKHERLREIVRDEWTEYLWTIDEVKP